MQQMTQIIANLQEASSSDSSRPPAFKTPSMKAPECLYGTQPFKVRSFIQSCQLIFHNDLANSSQDRKKAFYATLFLIGMAENWIEPYLSDLTNQDPRYLLNSWKLFQSQLFTLFGDPNEVRKSENEFDSLRMKEGGHVSLYIADFGSLVSRIGDWGERALIYHFRRGLASIILDQLTSYTSNIDSLQDLMVITLELDTRDEVFKDSQDVGEDDYVSSLHLFLGNMDLPHLSYHDSLEELWEEEEEPGEIETVIRVVPSVYHQYLDVFSKVKAEKLPSHCACDHHIELEGSLSPVG
ncbi:hypothetical protein O181_061288 [Austropuccinia psidii MF-1]|uniref:Retrotransposon gag domain-containing protein n=1 Tax=Austropuccinia psidii MF-1 TaxID=1389203 RepID=A0A9Q3HYD2_9BASI|nr:hypothetical protein [Austropuccinia psidii MF-1]